MPSILQKKTRNYLQEEGLPNPFTPKPIIVDDVEEDILDVSS